MREDAKIIPTKICDVCKQWRVVDLAGCHLMRQTSSSLDAPCYACQVWSRRITFVTFGTSDKKPPTPGAA